MGIGIGLQKEESVMNATTVAVDLAKSVFQLAVADSSWRVIASPHPHPIRALVRQSRRLAGHHGGLRFDASLGALAQFAWD